jgi:hypothetical protein
MPGRYSGRPHQPRRQALPRRIQPLRSLSQLASFPARQAPFAPHPARHPPQPTVTTRAKSPQTTPPPNLPASPTPAAPTHAQPSTTPTPPHSPASSHPSRLQPPVPPPATRPAPSSRPASSQPSRPPGTAHPQASRRPSAPTTFRTFPQPLRRFSALSHFRGAPRAVADSLTADLRWGNPRVQATLTRPMWGAINSDVPNLGAEWGAKTCDPHSATARPAHRNNSMTAGPPAGSGRGRPEATVPVG